MANDKYDAFPRAIIILLLDLFLVCRWQRATFWRLRRDEARRDAREHRLERYKRVRRTRGTRTRRGEPPTAASPSPLGSSLPCLPARRRVPLVSLSYFFLSIFFFFSSSSFSSFFRSFSRSSSSLRTLLDNGAHRCHHRDTDYKLHSICNEVHLFWRPALVAPGSR